MLVEIVANCMSCSNYVAGFPNDLMSTFRVVACKLFNRLLNCVPQKWVLSYLKILFPLKSYGTKCYFLFNSQ